jgi:hypothetical protein
METTCDSARSNGRRLVAPVAMLKHLTPRRVVATRSVRSANCVVDDSRVRELSSMLVNGGQKVKFVLQALWQLDVQGDLMVLADRIFLERHFTTFKDVTFYNKFRHFIILYNIKLLSISQ